MFYPKNVLKMIVGIGLNLNLGLLKNVPNIIRIWAQMRLCRLTEGVNRLIILLERPKQVLDAVQTARGGAVTTSVPTPPESQRC